MQGIENTPETILERIEEKPSGCWEWTGVLDKDGYGRTWYKGRGNVLVHRFVYETFVGPLIPNMVIMHSCDNRACALPDHLSQGTVKDNVQDALKKGRAYIGANNSNAKLTEFQVKTIHQMHATGVSINKLSKTFNVSRRQIHNIINGKSWEHLKPVEGPAEPGDADGKVLPDKLDAVGVEAAEK